MILLDAFGLGRVSNLPTVWTNMLTGIVLSGGVPNDIRTVPLFFAFTLFYVGGMYLNDAFDAGIDALERPERPIPAGRVSRRAVFGAGFGMLILGVALMQVAGSVGSTGPWPGLVGLALAGVIIFYNWNHKSNPLSPFVMGICRMLIYVGAGACFAVPPSDILAIGALVLLCYLIGLTYVAKQENLGCVKNMWPLAFLAVPAIYGLVLVWNMPWVWLFWVGYVAWVLVALHYVRRRGPGDIPQAVVSLIAGISLLDGLLIVGTGNGVYAVFAVLGFLLTLTLQRFVAGT